MRKVYVVLVKGSLGQIMVSVCSSRKKANRLAEIQKKCFEEVWIETEILI